MKAVLEAIGGFFFQDFLSKLGGVFGFFVLAGKFLVLI